MDHAAANLSHDQIMNLARNPLWQVTQALTQLEAINPKETDALRFKALRWVRRNSEDRFAFSSAEKCGTDYRSLGLINDQHQMDEQRFQLVADFLKLHFRQPPNFLRLRKFLQLHDDLAPDSFMTLSRAALDKSWPAWQKSKVERLAAIALSGGEPETPAPFSTHLSPEQYQTLRKVGAWVYPPELFALMPALSWLSELSSSNINWKQWQKICALIHPKLDQDPQPHLLQEWLK